MIYSVSEIQTLVNKRLAEIEYTLKPETLFQPVEYMLSLGGKRMRPVLCLLAANIYTDNLDDAFPVALGIEIFHNFTLMHDDLMDRAPLRRGKSTVHTLWNDNTAVLSGDAMLIEAYKQIARTAPNVLPAVLEKFSHTASQICCGQQLDMEFEQRFDVSFQEYLQMIELKTAVLPAVALELGALTAGAPHSDCSHLYHFGIQLGLAFQLQDDLLDVYGNEAEFGKNIGGDILCNKKTALLTQALANTDCKDNLLYWLQLSTSDAAEKIEAVRTIYNQLNLKQRVESQIIEYYNTAFKHLEFLHAPDDRKVELLTFAHTLTGRNN